MNDLVWSRPRHSLFGKEHNLKMAALMLGVRRLEKAGVVPALDCAVLEETLESMSLRPVPLEVVPVDPTTVIDDGEIGYTMLVLKTAVPVRHALIHITVPPECPCHAGCKSHRIGLCLPDNSIEIMWGSFLNSEEHCYTLTRRSCGVLDTELRQIDGFERGGRPMMTDVSDALSPEEDEVDPFREVDELYVFAIVCRAGAVQIFA